MDYPFLRIEFDLLLVDTEQKAIAHYRFFNKFTGMFQSDLNVEFLDKMEKGCAFLLPFRLGWLRG
jgi:hypothetical protein